MKKLGIWSTLSGIAIFIITFAVVANRQDTVYSSLLRGKGVPKVSGLTSFICSQQNALLVISIICVIVGLILWIANRHKE